MPLRPLARTKWLPRLARLHHPPQKMKWSMSSLLWTNVMVTRIQKGLKEGWNGSMSIAATDLLVGAAKAMSSSIRFVPRCSTVRRLAIFIAFYYESAFRVKSVLLGQLAPATKLKKILVISHAWYLPATQCLAFDKPPFPPSFSFYCDRPCLLLSEIAVFVMHGHPIQR